jgi:hypothetical protein
MEIAHQPDVVHRVLRNRSAGFAGLFLLSTLITGVMIRPGRRRG